MAAPRKRSRAVRPSGRTSRVSMLSTLNGTGNGDLGAAAQIIADAAGGLASWSRQVPPSITVEVDGKTATISSDAGPAYPNEIEGVRHPVFARGPDRRHWTWVRNQHRPFLAPAADLAGDKAMARYAQKIDGWARKAGYR